MQERFVERKRARQRVSWTLIATMVLSGIGSGVAHAAPSEVGPIVNPVLQACINEGLGHNEDTPITQAQLAGIEEIGCSLEGTGDLSGLEHATSLKELQVDSGANLDVATIGKLTSLERLLIDRNGLTEIPDLSTLTKLRWLSLDGNPLQSLSPLHKVSWLRGLSISGTDLADVSALSSMQELETIFATNNGLSDLEPLSKLSKLRNLNLSHNAISNTGPLAKLANLEFLYLDGNEVRDLKPLAGLNNLLRLSMENNLVVDFSPFAASSARMVQITYQNIDLTHQAGVPAPNPVIGFDGEPVQFDSDFYDAVTNTFTFPEAGTYTVGWEHGLFSAFSSSGALIWQVSAEPQLLTVPQNPAVTQATRDTDGSIIDPTVVPAETVGLRYELSLSDIRPGDTVIVTAVPVDGYVIDAAGLLPGWKFDEPSGTAEYAVTLNELDPLPDDGDDEEPGDNEEPGDGGTKPIGTKPGMTEKPGTGVQTLAATGGETAMGYLLLGAGVLLLGGAYMTRRGQRSASR